MTDAPPRQDSPEDDDGRSSSEHAPGTQSQQGQTRTQDPPQWAAEQPEPAPWFLGRPGPAPQPFPVPVPLPPLPPPDADQASWPDQAPGTRPEQAPVPPWTGQVPPNPEQPNSGGDGAQSRPGANPQQPPQQPPQQQPPQQQPLPWLDPNRYTQPGSRPPAPGQDPRLGYRPPQQQPQRSEEPAQRPPLSLQTRWARGLALGGALCTLITLLNGYRNFPAWLIGAAVALLMSLGGLWLGAFAQRDAMRQSQRAPEAVASVVWSGISTLIAVAIVAFSLIFYPQLRDFSACMRAANTIAAQNACQQQFDTSMTFKP